MTSAEYRARAEDALTPEGLHTRPKPEAVAEADVWAKLAVSAAIEEQGQVTTDGE